MPNHPTAEIAIALAGAEVPEEIIDWKYLEAARRWMDAPIDRSVKYLGSTENGEQVSVNVARCHCGWFSYFSTLESAPDKCPRCGAELPLKEI